MQIEDAVKEETVLAAYWVTDGIDRCQLNFVPHHLFKHVGKYDGVLAQITDVFGAADDSNYRRQNVMQQMKQMRQCHTQQIKRICNNFKQIHEKDTSTFRKKRSAKTKKVWLA